MCNKKMNQTPNQHIFTQPNAKNLYAGQTGAVGRTPFFAHTRRCYNPQDHSAKDAIAPFHP